MYHIWGVALWGLNKCVVGCARKQRGVGIEGSLTVSHRELGIVFRVAEGEGIFQYTIPSCATYCGYVANT